MWIIWGVLTIRRSSRSTEVLLGVRNRSTGDEARWSQESEEQAGEEYPASWPHAVLGSPAGSVLALALSLMVFPCARTLCPLYSIHIIHG